MPWSRFRGTRGYEGDHNAGPHNCLRKTVQVVTRRENLQRDRERRARKEGVYSLAYLAVKTKAAIAKGKAKRSEGEGGEGQGEGEGEGSSCLAVRFPPY